MEIRYNVTGSERKRLVTAIAGCLNCKPVYKGMPSCAYEVDGYIIDKEGTLVFDDRFDSEEVELVLETLAREGFQCEAPAEEPPTGLSIAVPDDKVSIDTLIKLLEAKGKLIQKALGASTVQITVEDDRVEFNWFDRELTPDEVNAYMLFITSLCRLSMELKRVVIKEAPVDNEKYAFRCFLLRLGFIGEEYKGARKILLSRLSGSAAFKSGVKGGGRNVDSE